MAFDKKDEFTPAYNQLATFAKALSHPARIAIIKELANRKSCICGEIVEVLPLAQSTVSQHLKELKRAGIIQGTINGTTSCYCLNPEVFSSLSSGLLDFCQSINQQAEKLACC